MALTKARPRRAPESTEPQRTDILASWWFLTAAVVALLVAFGWAFLMDPSLPAPTRDPAWYTWRTELLQHAHPSSLIQEWGPKGLFSGGYRVTIPVLGALLMQVAGMSKFTFTALMMVSLPVLASLALGVFAFRHRRDPLVLLLTLLAGAALFLTVPWVGYMDNVMCLYFLALTLPFLEPARTSWGARSAIFLLTFLAALTHPTTLAIFALVLGAAAGVHFVTSRFSIVKTLQADGPMVVSAALGSAFGLAMWKIGIWGVKAPFADAALPPPYPAEFFRARLGDWLGGLRPLITFPLVAVAIVSVFVTAIRKKEKADRYSTISVLWLLPLAGLFGYVAGLTYPYYRFLTATLALMLLAGMGAWVIARLGLRYLKGGGIAVVVLMFAALGFALSQGLSDWNSSDPDSRWLQPDTRVALASVSAYAASEPGDQPIVFVVNYRDDRRAYGWAKTYSNTARAGLAGDQALRSYIYFGDVDRFLAGQPTPGNDPIYRQWARRYALETERGLKAYSAKPVVFLAAPFNQEPHNTDAIKRFTRIAPTDCAGGQNGCAVAVVTGARTASVSGDAVAAARQAGRAQVQALASPPGLFDDPLHLLRVFAGLALILVVPGLIASRWFELEGAADRLALIPGLSIGLVVFSGIFVIAVTRTAFGAVQVWASVVLAIAIAVVLELQYRRRQRGKAVIMPFVHRALSLFSNTNFAALMGAVFLAVLGDGIVQGALAKTIAFGGGKGFDITKARSARDILALVLLTYLPYSFVSPFLGVLIDRFDRRRLLIVANGARAVVVGLVGVALFAAGDLANAALIGALLLTLASTRLVLAIKSAGIPGVLKGKDLIQGNSISQAGQAVFQLVGAGIALVGTAVVSAGIVLVLGAAVYGVGAVFAARVSNLAEQRQTRKLSESFRRILGNLADGLGQVRRRAAAKLALFAFLALRILFAYVLIVFALEARKLFGGTNSKMALLVPALAGALGAGIGFVLAQLLKERIPPARLLSASMLCMGIGVIAFGGIVSVFGLSMVAFVAALTYFVGKISADTLTQQALPDNFRGRAFSLFDVAYNVAWIIPALVLFAVWQTDRVRILLVGAGVLFVLVAIATVAWARRLGLETATRPTKEPAPAE